MGSHGEFELADHVVEMLVPGDDEVEGTSIEVVVSEAWKLDVDIAGVGVEIELCVGLQLPEIEEDTTVEEAVAELLVGSGPGVSISEACELGTGNNTVVDWKSDDEL